MLDSLKKLALKAKKKKEKKPNEKIKKQQEFEEAAEKDDPDTDSGVGEGLGLEKVFKSKDEEWEGGKFADGGEPRRSILMPPSPQPARNEQHSSALSSAASGNQEGGEEGGAEGGADQVNPSAPQFVLKHVVEERGREDETERERQERELLEEDYLPPLAEPSGDIGEKERQFWAQVRRWCFFPCEMENPTPQKSTRISSRAFLWLFLTI